MNNLLIFFIILQLFLLTAHAWLYFSVKKLAKERRQLLLTGEVKHDQ